MIVSFFIEGNKAKEAMHTFSNLGYVVTILILMISCENDTLPAFDDCTHQLNVEELRSTWILEKVIDKETNESESFPDGRLSGITFHGDDCITVGGPCNGGPGKYILTGNEVQITKLAMTEKGCSNDIMEFEDTFTRNLSGTYCISGDKLTIISNSDKDLILKKADHMQSYECVDL